MSNPIKMSKADLFDTLRFSFHMLTLKPGEEPRLDKQGNIARQGVKFTPNAERLAAMARAIESKTLADPTRMASPTLDDIRPMG